MRIDLDADHVYRVEGEVVPGVTGLLAEAGVAPDYADVPDDLLARAAARGTAVHLATQYDDDDRLDESTLDPQIAPYLAAWRQFRADTHFDPDRIEHRVFHPTLRYAGTVDRIGMVLTPDGARRRVLLDLKSTAAMPRHVGPQTAAYAAAVQGDPAIGRIDERWAVHLQRPPRPGGPPGYRVHRLSDPDDYAVFYAALTLHRWRLQHA